MLRSVSVVAVALYASVYFLGTPDGWVSDQNSVPQDHRACGTVYVVAPGDTLSEIALRVYGTNSYVNIFEANRSTLKNPEKIQIGDRLLIPCAAGAEPRRDGSGLEAGYVAQPASLDPTEVGAGVDAGITIVTGSDFAPFVDSRLHHGGMTSEMVGLAMSAGAPGPEFRIALVKDWSIHFGLLEEHAFDLGFPWYRPDCSKLDNLSASMRRRCTNFDFSDPLFEVAIGYYVRAGDALAAAKSYDGLRGKRICRPANHFTFDLDQAGLDSSTATLRFAADGRQCFDWLARGEVDVVTLATLTAKGAISAADLDGEVAEIPALASVQTLHAVAPKNDPAGRANLDRLNLGLARLRESGRWTEIAWQHLAAYGVSIR